MTSTHPTQFRQIGLVTFASMAFMCLCDPMLMTLANEFQATKGEASRVISAFAVAYGVLQLFYGPLGDRIGKLRVIVMAVFNGLTGLAPS